MARFDLYRPKDGDELLLDCQSDALGELDSRFVVPLLPTNYINCKFLRLNPEFQVGSDRFVLATQSAATVPVRMLGSRIGSLSQEHDRIMSALDMLLTGY